METALGKGLALGCGLASNVEMSRVDVSENAAPSIGMAVDAMVEMAGIDDKMSDDGAIFALDTNQFANADVGL